MNTQRAVGERVRATRQARGIGVAEFAEMVGWDRWTLWRTETGRRSTTLAEVDVLARALRVPTVELLSGREAA